MIRNSNISNLLAFSNAKGDLLNKAGSNRVLAYVACVIFFSEK